jgi:AcrR family transcriptional regulator
MRPVTAQGSSRRAEYAAATREAILNAARSLFIERGYFETRVEDIAKAARVAVPTVYAAGGGKSGLLRTLLDEGVKEADSGDLRERIAAHAEPAALVRMIVDGTCGAFRTWSPLVRQMMAAAPQDAAIRQSLVSAHASLRAGLAATAARLEELGALTPGTSAEQATDVLWYYLNNASYFSLTDDCQWTLERSADWLYEQLTTELFDRSPVSRRVGRPQASHD